MFMAWETYKVEEQRLQLVRAYNQKEASMAFLCRQYGVSRKTGYKWVQRHLELGEEGLRDCSKAPLNPKHIYDSFIIDQVIALKLLKPNWGPKKIAWKLKELYPNQSWPSPTRLYQIFKELYLVTSRRLRNRVPATAPLGELTACNNTWTVDLKGWFRTGDGHKCEPFTIADAYSRFLIRCCHLDTHTVEDVWPIFDEAFREFGLPNRIRSDNGPPFGSIGVGRLTPLSVKLIKAGVMPEWTRPGHPEDNGRHERVHLTLQQETANPPKATLALQIQAISEFLHEYNFERPHEALNMCTPGSWYRPSSKTWDGIFRPPEYDRREMEVRKVGPSGCISVNKIDHYIGVTLTGEYVGLKAKADDKFEAYYGAVYLGKLDLRKGLEKPKLKTRKPSWQKKKSDDSF
jgi:putative transposase